MLKKFAIIVSGTALSVMFLFLYKGYTAEVKYSLEKSEIINAPIEKVWQYINEIEKIAQRRTEITRIEFTGKNDKGLPRWREYISDKDYMPFEMLERKKPNLLKIRLIDSPFGYSATWTFQLKKEKKMTQVSIQEKSINDSFLFRLALSLMGQDIFMRQEFGYMKKSLERENATIQ